MKNPSDIQKHGPTHGIVGRSLSRKRHRGAKRNLASGDSSMELSNGKTTTKELANNDTRSSIPNKIRIDTLRFI
jgi:hypothetical protein